MSTTARLSTKPLLLIIIVLVLCVYTQYYMKYVTGYKLVQSTLDKIGIDALYERNPIIISDRIVNPLQLTSTLFKYTYSFQQNHVVKTTDMVMCTHHKYTIIHNNASEMTVHILNPIFKKSFKPFTPSTGLLISSVNLNDSNAEYVTIKLKKQQCMILPMHWMYEANRPHSVILLDDPMTLVIFTLINLFNRR